MSRHLLLIDAHAILHRAYHAIPKLSTQGQPVNAIYGFYSMLLSALDQLKPTHLTVCLDSPGPTFRDQEYIGYRAQRQPPDRDLLDQIPELPKTLHRAKLSHFALGGYEADDIIATLARRSSKMRRRPTNKVTIITGDKDLMQLVTPKVKLFMPQRGLSQSQLFGPKAVKTKLGLKPSQVVDMKALMGDPSDNYPGVSGIGPKTAVDLLSTYGSLDAVYQNLKKIKENFRKKLETDKDNAYLSQKLAQLVFDVPVKFSFKKARWNQKTATRLLPLFQSYNFKSLVSRLKKLYPELDPKSPKSNPNQSSLF